MPLPTAGPGPLLAPTGVAAPGIFPTVQSPSVQSSQQYGVMPGNWPISRPGLLPGPYIPGTYSPMLLPPGMVVVPGSWTPYPVDICNFILSMLLNLSLLATIISL